MSSQKAKEIAYEIVRSPRATADIVVERDGRIIVRAPAHLPDERVEDIVEAKRYYIQDTGRVARPQCHARAAGVS